MSEKPWLPCAGFIQGFVLGYTDQRDNTTFPTLGELRHYCQVYDMNGEPHPNPQVTIEELWRHVTEVWESPYCVVVKTDKLEDFRLELDGA